MNPWMILGDVIGWVLLFLLLSFVVLIVIAGVISVIHPPKPKGKRLTDGETIFTGRPR